MMPTRSKISFRKFLACAAVFMVLTGAAHLALISHQSSTGAPVEDKAQLVSPSPFLALGRERGSLAASLPKGGESGDSAPVSWLGRGTLIWETKTRTTTPFSVTTYLKARRASCYGVTSYLKMRRLDLVFEWARAQLGSRSYDGYCQKFVRIAFEIGGFKYDGASYIGSAKDAFHVFGVVRWDDAPTLDERAQIPVGATLYFNTGHWGHVGIVTKQENGVVTMIHAVGKVEEVLVSESWWEKAIGWGFQGKEQAKN